jgi:hypothetical protein
VRAKLTYRFATNEKSHLLSGEQLQKLASCTRNKENRAITRLAAAAAERSPSAAANPRIMRRRKAIIEHCFGTIKRSFGYD